MFVNIKPTDINTQQCFPKSQTNDKGSDDISVDKLKKKSFLILQ